jgi:hypothetical protein
MILEIRVLFEAAFWLNLIFTFQKPPMLPFVGHVAVGLALTWYWAWCRGRVAASLDRAEREVYANSFYKPLTLLYMPMLLMINLGSGDYQKDIMRFVGVLLLVRFYLFLDRLSTD